MRPWRNYHRCVLCFSGSKANMDQTQPNLQNNFQAVSLVYYPQQYEWFRVRSLFIFQRLNDRAMSVPSPDEAVAKRAKCLNNRRYAVDHRSGMVDRNVDVSTTDDEFSAPLSTNDDRSKQKSEGVRERESGGVGDKETSKQRDQNPLPFSRSLAPPLSRSRSHVLPLPHSHSPHCQTRPAKVKYARSYW